jgi:uncharacterized protein
VKDTVVFHFISSVQSEPVSSSSVQKSFQSGEIMKKIMFLILVLLVNLVAAADNQAANEKLITAAQTDNIAAMQNAMKEGADVNYFSDFDLTALHIVCTRGFLEGTKFLIQAGADVNAENPQKYTPIIYAVLSKKPLLIPVLATAKANLEQRTTGGGSYRAIHFAAKIGDLDVINALLDAKADVNSKDGYAESTALMVAARWNLSNGAETITLMLKRGALLNYRDRAKNTALGYAIQAKNTEAIKVLKEAGGTE